MGGMASLRTCVSPWGAGSAAWGTRYHCGRVISCLEMKNGSRRTSRPREKPAPSGAEAVDKDPGTPKTEKSPAPSPVLVAQASGLYALGGRTLRGVPKSPEALTGRGLWPLPHRWAAEVEEDEEEDAEEEDFW